MPTILGMIFLGGPGEFRTVSNAALANATLVLSFKIGKSIRDGGSVEK